MSFKTVTPAYGRDYKSAKTARADWANGKDFVLQPEGKYIGKSEADAAGMTIMIRYSKNRRITQADK